MQGHLKKGTFNKKLSLLVHGHVMTHIFGNKNLEL